VSLITAMIEPSSSEERLRAVGTLMERASVYRGLSAKSGLLAGLLSLCSATVIYLNGEGHISLGRRIHGRDFAAIWIGVLLLSIIATIGFLGRDARRNGRSLFSAELQSVVNQIVPYLLVPAVFTVWFLGTGYLGGEELNLVVVWIAFYGLVLLSMSLFAPRSLSLLGWVFLLTSIAVPLVRDSMEDRFSFDIPNFLMGLTFGFYHLVYAALNWPRRLVARQ
jgi:hypothetical protein